MLLAVCVGSVEGGTVGVMVSSLFRDTVGAATLGVVLAVLFGAANFANIGAIGWSTVAQGRDPARLLRLLQIGCAACVFLLVGVPRTQMGLARVIVGVVGVRLLWSGILILRTSLWRLNFRRVERARVVGRIVALHYLLVAVTTAVVGTTVQRFPDALSWLYAVATLSGLGGAVLHWRAASLTRDARDRVETEGIEESEYAAPNDRASLKGAWAIFRGDPDFRGYLLALLALDGGVLMAITPLVLALNDVFRLDSLVQTALLATIPTLTVPLAAPFFAARLGRLHVLQFRARQSWLMAGAALLFAIGVSIRSVPVLFVASVLLGLGYAGGSITWHIAHHEFATPRQSADYMALNTLLTGIRGVIMPFCGISLYRWAEGAQPGSGPLVLFVAAAVTIAGAAGFVSQSLDRREANRADVETLPGTAPRRG